MNLFCDEFEPTQKCGMNINMGLGDSPNKQ